MSAVVVLAIVLLVLAALLVIAVVGGDGQAIALEIFGADVETSVSGVFVTGVVVGLVALLAIVMLRVGLKKGWRRRQRIKDLERRAVPTDDQAAPPVSERPPVTGGRLADEADASRDSPVADEADASGDPALGDDPADAVRPAEESGTVATDRVGSADDDRGRT